MNEDEVNYLEKILANEKNEQIINTTFKDIDREKKEILGELELSKTHTTELIKKLEDYKYIDELQGLEYGRYLRWINLKNPEKLKLTNGGILCEIKIDDNIFLVLKNKQNWFFQINLNENLIFQKLTDQEKIILYAVNYLNSAS
jgi:hypothetical protein